MFHLSFASFSAVAFLGSLAFTMVEGLQSSLMTTCESVPLQGRSLTTTTATVTFEAPFEASGGDLACMPGYIICGTRCCLAGNACTVDAVGNFACCPDNNFCTGTLPATSAQQTAAPTTNTPVNAGGKITSSRLMGLLTLLLGICFALDLVPGAPNNSLDSHGSTGANDSSKSYVSTASSAASKEVCGNNKFLVREWHECCPKDTLPFLYLGGQHGCCSKTLRGLSAQEIEVYCPVAAGQNELTLPEHEIETSSSAVVSRDIDGPWGHCGGFDIHCVESAAGRPYNIFSPLAGLIHWVGRM